MAKLSRHELLTGSVLMPETIFDDIFYGTTRTQEKTKLSPSGYFMRLAAYTERSENHPGYVDRFLRFIRRNAAMFGDRYPALQRMNREEAGSVLKQIREMDRDLEYVFTMRAKATKMQRGRVRASIPVAA